MFAKLDVRQAHHCMQAAAGPEFKTTFKTCYGLYEYLVMPFGLMNAPAQFQVHRQNIFNDLFDILVVIYLDDIIIFPKSLEENKPIVQEVLQRLQVHSLYAKISKCQFHQISVEFLEVIILEKAMEMCQEKV